MLGLPEKTRVQKQLPKNHMYEQFNMSSMEQKKFDSDISKLFITNELSPSTLHVQEGKTVHSFFVVRVDLKQKKYSEKTIVTISRLIPQNMVFVLTYGIEVQLAIVTTRLHNTHWMHESEASVPIEGLSMDSIWQNVVLHIANIEQDDRYTLEEQITRAEKKRQVQEHIAKLEDLVFKEKQPRKKLELFEQLQELKKGRRDIK